ncbi:MULTISPECIES: sigma-70 family RNA polymerase sigma factor [unclassified Microbacterium]|uniref:sigma-70 family RNA polymerase sigma factor n=1 Tax=unclassified Microbacterium TaxID=2609290 RepID=UPI001604FC1A|nr:MULTISPECIES: sigma-70 family RNA polymerase sigma factor [unclassified Microbacterium]QNA93566.1 sigma-70 family RNA polymerase sigma factor [Microbacterium sp. Se63.02b]QYM63819.1 sigma-70 family RNA polymerase sigma factor [Microbacterium sp. Se5.02b]
MEDSRGDAELLRALREGDQAAYAALWERHVGAALRYAHRLLPSHPEDLVSEAFVAVYQQVTTTSAGPQFAFRSYLKAVIRNTAIRWRKEAEHIDDTVEADQVDFRDALRIVERRSNAHQLLGAFQALPERWQRILWLTEVAEMPRPEIAVELGIKPNAVSALQRRARTGLKVHWLTAQVPAGLRDDEAHAARLFPRHLAEPQDATVAQEVADHVSSCDSCGELLLTLRSDARRLHGVTLSAVGFGALGVVVPSAGAFAPGTAAAAVAILATGAGVGVTTLLAGGVGVLTAGTLLLSTLLFPGGAPIAAAPAVAETDTTSAVEAPARPGAGAPAGTDATPAPVPATLPPTSRTGRWNDDPTIDSVDLVNDPDAPVPLSPTRPGTAPGTTPGPGESPGSTLSPGVSTPATQSGYLAPVLTGVATPGSAVGVDVDGARYTPEVAPDGAWSFDPRALELAAGTYDYQAWAFDDAGQSPATAGSFTILPIVIEGFEDIVGTEDMQIAEASTTGLVIAATGPANGSIYITTMQGHTAIFPLDDTGHAVKRLRMHSRGWYWFTFRALDADGFWGPAEERPLDVYDPDIIFDPWGPGPEEMTFEVVDP